MILSSDLNANKHAIVQAVLHPVTSNPSSPVDGQVWYRSDTDRLMLQANGSAATIAVLDDVTAGAITAALWDAQTIIGAVVDNTPVPITISEGTLLGRSAGGDISAQSATQVRAILNVASGATANSSDAALRARSSHTGTQTASTISDFDASVASNAAVAANTAKVSNATHTGDVTGSGALTIASNAVTNAKAADMATNTIKGRATAATGDPEDLTAAQVRTILNVANGATANASDAALRARSSHTGTQTASTISDLAAAVAGNAAVAANTAKVSNATHTGDVTGSTALTIANNAVTNAKLATQPTARIKGRVTAGTGNTEDLTAAQVLSMLGVEAGATADQSAAEILTLIKTVDGSGSGLDADTLDGIQASGFATTASLSGLASESYVNTAISNLVDTAPGTLNTLNELAAALGDDPNFASTITTSIAAKAGKYATDIGNGSLNPIPVTHSLGTTDVVVSVRLVSTGEVVLVDWVPTNANTITLTFGSTPTTNQYRVVVVG